MQLGGQPQSPDVSRHAARAAGQGVFVAITWTMRPIAMNKATTASPKMSPEESGKLYLSSLAGCSLAQIHCTIPPTTIGPTEMPGTSMPMPMAVGDGTNLR